MAEPWGQWLYRTLVGNLEPKPEKGPALAQLHAGGKFKALRDFEIICGRDRTHFNICGRDATNFGPLMGQYFAPHVYDITLRNGPAVNDAVAAGYAAILVPPTEVRV